MKNEELDQLDFGEWPLPTDYLTELGRIAALWPLLEGHFDMCLGKLAGFKEVSDWRSFVLLKHTTLPQKLDAFATLCDGLTADYPHLATHKDVLAKIRSAQASRNRLFHHLIGQNPDTGQVEIAIGSARGTLRTEVKPLGIHDVKRVTTEIQLAMAALHSLVTQHKIAPPWAKK